ncbi:MAG: thioredoxin family protein [Saprospiraceae bacterium]|nr:thioredoxin family protein [Candidatus Defluviibacterium haderslevense]
MKYKFLSIFLLLTLCQCADWEQVTQLKVNPGIISNRVVLVEDFTGASCTNCPGAASTLESLLEKYPNNLIVVGVHSRFLGLPAKSGDPNFVTPEAEDIEKFLGAWDGKPEAAFNRRLFPNEKRLELENRIHGFLI